MKHTVAMQLLGASEYALSIALAVFVTSTAILLAFIVLIFANGKFRSLFFGGRDEPASKNEQTGLRQPAVEEVEAIKVSSPKSESEPEKQKPSPRKKRSDDPVPTVPIDFPFTPAQPTQSRRAEPTYANTFERAPAAKKPRTATETRDRIPTVFIPRTGTQPTVKQSEPTRRRTAEKPAEAEKRTGLPVGSDDAATAQTEKKAAKSVAAKPKAKK